MAVSYTHLDVYKRQLVHYEKELENFKANLALLKEKQNGNAVTETVEIAAWTWLKGRGLKVSMVS